MKCKVCSKEKHACASCGLEDWEWDYCSTECNMKANNKKAVDLLDKLVVLGLPADKREDAMDAITEEMEWV